MKKIQIISTFLLFLIIACTRDQVEEVNLDCEEGITYDNGIKEIIDSSCSYSGCHDGAGGIGPGNYKVYDRRLLSDLESGSFEQRVINEMDNPVTGMPPSQTIYPETRKERLTEEELLLVRCWLEAGHPEN